jgi:uncharacterized protein YlxW (UPF0749 family)
MVPVMSTVENERHQARRPDASMSLLNNIAAEALDPDYHNAAERRAAVASLEVSEAEPSSPDIEESARPSGRRRPRWAGSIALGLGLLSIGLLVSVAADRVRDTESVVSSERATLIERIHTANDETDALQDQIATLEAQVRALETAQLDSSAVGSVLNEQATMLQAVVGTRRVTGPGVVVTLDNAPEDWPGRDPETSDVLDVDIQQVVNALWEAGAEAVAVNGERITSTTAIRSANDLIQVNYRPLSPPYHVSAVGDDQDLVTRFDQGQGASWLRSANAIAGIQFSVEVADDDLELPAGSAPLIYAAIEEDS